MATAHFVPQQRGYLIAHQAIEHAPCLLRIHQVLVDVAGMLEGFLHGALRDLINHQTDPVWTFNEITKRAVQEAFEHPRDIDQHLVDAQQARRVLDRLVAIRYPRCCGTKWPWPIRRPCSDCGSAAHRRT